MKKLLILAFMAVVSFSIEIDAYIYTGLNATFGMNNMNRFTNMIPNVLTLALPYEYTYYTEQGTLKVLSVFNNPYKPVDRPHYRGAILDAGSNKDVNDLLYFLARDWNIEKVLAEGNFIVKDWGLSAKMKLHAASNKLDEPFTYKKFSKASFEFTWDNLIGPHTLLYTSIANKEKSGFLHMLKEETTYDKSFIFRGIFDPVKTVNFILKPKLYYNYEFIPSKSISYDFTTAIAVETDFGLNVELGVDNYKDFVNPDRYIVENQINNLSQSAPGVQKYEYYKKYEHAFERDLKKAQLTNETGVSRLDGLYSGSLYGESLLDFSITRLRKYFVDNNYSGAKDVFTGFIDDDKTIGLLLIPLGKFGNDLKNRLPNEIDKIALYMSDQIMSKLNLSVYGDYDKYYPLTFLPKEMRSAVPNLLKEYYDQKDAKTFDISEIQKSFDIFSKLLQERWKRTQFAPLPYTSGSSGSHSLPTIEYNGKTYEVSRHFSMVGDDFSKYLIEPMKKLIGYDKIVSSSTAGIVWHVFTNLGNYGDILKRVLTHNESLPELDLLRSIYFYETEYMNRTDYLHDKLSKEYKKLVDIKNSNLDLINDITNNDTKKDILDARDKNLFVKNSAKKSEPNTRISTKLSYTNEDYGLDVGLNFKYTLPYKISYEYQNSPTSGAHKLLNGKEYNFLGSSRNLERITNSNDIASQGSIYAKKEHHHLRYFHYVTKHKLEKLVSSFTEDNYKTNVYLKYNKNGLKIDAKSGFDYSSYDVVDKREILVYAFDQGVLHETFSTFKEATFEDVKDKTPIHTVYKGLEYKYSLFTLDSSIDISYTHNPSEQFELSYGISYFNKFNYINIKKLDIDGSAVTVEVVKRDEKGNPIDLNGDSVKLINTTEYALKQKFNVKNARDALQKDYIKPSTKIYGTTHEVMPSIQVIYRPIKKLGILVRGYTPVRVYENRLDGFIIGVQAGIRYDF